jgi:hypothetical protein
MFVSCSIESLFYLSKDKGLLIRLLLALILFLMNEMTCHVIYEESEKNNSSKWNCVYIISNATKPHETNIGANCLISYGNQTSTMQILNDMAYQGGHQNEIMHCIV